MIISICTGPWLPVPALQGGAIPRIWQGLAEEFVAKGHEVTILCRSYPGQPQKEEINDVKYIRWGGFSQSTNIWWDLLKDLAYAVMISPILPEADILIINDFWLPVFASLRPKAGKVIINAARFPKGQYRLYTRVTRFAAVSKAIQEAIAQQYPPAIPRVKVIPNPIDAEIFHPSDYSRSGKKEKVILYVGRIHPEKGIHLLLDAFAILSQQISTVKLRIIGPFKEEQGGGGKQYLHILKSKAQGLNVEFIPPIFDVAKLAESYREADIFCYPSLAEKGESFGVAPLEAMASGLVPVVSDLACFRDFIDDGITGYFFNHSLPDADKLLSTTLVSAILNVETTLKMGRKAAQKAQEFSYSNIAELYLSDFDYLMKGK